MFLAVPKGTSGMLDFSSRTLRRAPIDQATVTLGKQKKVI
jgi:hypothetical protein